MHQRVLIGIVAASACFSDPIASDGGEPGSTGPASDASTSTSAEEAGSGSDANDTTAAATGTESDAGSEGSSSTSTGDDAGSGCGESETCESVAPQDWTGPFVVVTGDRGSAPPCPAAWPEPLATLHRGLVAPDFACACECTPPASVCVATIALYVDGACGLLDTEETADANDCVLTGSATTISASAVADPTPEACSEGVEITETPVSWRTNAALCTFTTAPTKCDAGVCIPQLDATARNCVSREGEHACPPGPYAIGETFYSGTLDERGCSACSCAAPTGAVCQGVGQVELFDDGDCSDAPVAAAGLGQCATATTSARYVPQDLGECGIDDDTEPTGSATPAGPVTLCCTR